MLNILSLGAGVQSSTVLLMSCRGVLPKLDAAIFADTGWEPEAVYEWLEVLKREMGNAGIPYYQVSKGDIRADALRSRMRKEEYKDVEGGRWAAMPLFTMTKERRHEGTIEPLYDDEGEEIDEQFVPTGDFIEGEEQKGQVKRQCTAEYKIMPVQRQIRLLLKEANQLQACQWFGISSDEMRRMRMSKVRYIEHYYPLIFGLERPYHRHDCLKWLADIGYPKVPRSACLGCPFHSDDEWRAIKTRPKEWADVVEFDENIRKVGGRRGDTFLHSSCKPLSMVDLLSKEQKGQKNWLNECEGQCGV
jgi:hypothetical protein